MGVLKNIITFHPFVNTSFIGKVIVLFVNMCKENNISCKALYERLIARGKNSKLALIAVCNKLLRQVFGVVKIIQPVNPIIVHLNLEINIEKCSVFYTDHVSGCLSPNLVRILHCSKILSNQFFTFLGTTISLEASE